MSRSQRRTLRRQGSVRVGSEERRTVSQRADQLVARLWEEVPQMDVVVWADNFYRARHVPAQPGA